MNSWLPDRQRPKMPRSTVAPRLSELDMKQNFLIIVEMMVVVMKTIDDGGEYYGCPFVFYVTGCKSGEAHAIKLRREILTIRLEAT